MGRLNNSDGDDRKRFLKHPCHGHHLELTSAAVDPSYRAACFGCHGSIMSGLPHLSCRACGFYLHRDCYDFPERIRHPGHDHVLVLDTYGTDSFQCKACGSDGHGFAYRCTTCRQDFHCGCTAKALLVTDPFVHKHELKLCFKAPYEGETGFRCDLCGREGYSWVYCCQGCHFDVHIDYPRCKAARIFGTTRTVGDTALLNQTQMRNIQVSVPRNFPIVTDQAISSSNGTNVTTTRSPINNTSLRPPQLRPNGSFGYVTGQGGAAPTSGSPYFVYLRPPQGNNQPVYLRPNGGPLTAVQPNTGFAYGMPMMTNVYPRQEMKDMSVGGSGSGLGRIMGKAFLGMSMSALSLGGGSLTGLDLGGDASDFLGSYAGEWASDVI